MATEVTLPDMGEEVEDVTISRWLVKEGQEVNAGQPLLEIATDKVDTEVPAPTSGTLLSIRFGEGEIVDLEAVIAVIGEATEESPPVPAPSDSAPAVTGANQAAAADSGAILSGTRSGGGQDSRRDELSATPVAKRIASEAGIPLAAIPGREGEQISKSDVETYLRERADAGRPDPDGGTDRQEDSPTPDSSVASLELRRLAATYDIDLREVSAGRPVGALTRHDPIEYAREQKGLSHLSAATFENAPKQPTARDRDRAAAPVQAAGGDTSPGQEASDETLIPHSRMRQVIARNMVRSAFTAPHVTTVHSVDMGTVTGHYQAQKAEFARQGVRLTLTAYIVAAVVKGLKAVPAANAEWTDEGLKLKHVYNIGMAVALPADETGVGGLIVPVIRDAGDMNLLGIARQVADLAARARENKLTASETQGGTFTLTNYGTSGSLFQTPVILQPQVAILGTGAIEKRPVVVSSSKPYEASVDDYLAFRPMMDLALSYDHRVLDGASADAFCGAVKREIEEWPQAT
ncbi:MAG: dihydrolipoamide acetyltransferase family protein [Caldilineaceae bacterium]|nr:dihydrolipoamide acetyltransferase family protein [Caldilineaceae bacterium]MDE0337130.1 dihydrolipoamide acetyltransferase family protein [Caldilineaceae bacterium]